MRPQISLKAAEKVIAALLEVHAEDFERIAGLEARVAEHVTAWSAPPDWKAMHQKIQDLLKACDEQERQADEYGVSREQAIIAVSDIRRILTT